MMIESGVGLIHFFQECAFDNCFLVESGCICNHTIITTFES